MFHNPWSIFLLALLTEQLSSPSTVRRAWRFKVLSASVKHLVTVKLFEILPVALFLESDFARRLAVVAAENEFFLPISLWSLVQQLCQFFSPIIFPKLLQHFREMEELWAIFAVIIIFGQLRPLAFGCDDHFSTDLWSLPLGIDVLFSNWIYLLESIAKDS